LQHPLSWHWCNITWFCVSANEQGNTQVAKWQHVIGFMYMQPCVHETHDRFLSLSVDPICCSCVWRVMEEQAAYTMASSIFVSSGCLQNKTNVRKKCAGARCAHAAMPFQAAATVRVTAPAQGTYHQPQTRLKIRSLQSPDHMNYEAMPQM